MMNDLENCSDGDSMRTEKIMYFTEKEEEFTDFLIEIGMKKNVAKILVFLGNIPEASSHAIERGTDLRQPEVSIAIQYLSNRGWVKSHDSQSDNKGRPNKIYELAVPITEIMDSIEKEEKDKVNKQLKLIKKLRSYLN